MREQLSTRSESRRRRYDRTLRAVMWMDAFLSVAIAVVSMLAVPVVSTLGVPQGVVSWLGYSVLVSAVLLAAFGAITGVALMLRMRDGNYFLPARLRVPLPAGMRPDFD
jgi:uncharacterized membrane protein